jgi:hypothetical protein
VRPRLALVVSSLGAVALTAASVAGFGARRWRAETQKLVDRLKDSADSAAELLAVVSFAEHAALPPPVQQFFRTVLIEGLPCIETARIVQTGRFNLAATGDDWHAFDAVQTYRVRPPGYVWDARIHLAPFADVNVRDAYVDEQGTMHGRVFSLFDVVNESGTHELNEGTLQRYLAEAVMFPTALLPSAGVSWSPIDDTHAWASIVDGDAAARLQFEFAPSGEVAAVWTPSRYRAEAGAYVGTPWGGRFRSYETAYGMRVPSEAEVYWDMNGERRTYVRLTVKSFRYGFARPASATNHDSPAGVAESR